MNKILIAPSILSADFSKLGQEIKDVKDAGADWIHVDVMDGHFVPNLTIGPVVVKSIRPVTKLPLDVHLMIKNPARFVESFVRAGADIITFHIESEDDSKEVIRIIKYFKKKVGVSIRPKTGLKMIDYVLFDPYLAPWWNTEGATHPPLRRRPCGVACGCRSRTDGL